MYIFRLLIKHVYKTLVVFFDTYPCLCMKALLFIKMNDVSKDLRQSKNQYEGFERSSESCD